MGNGPECEWHGHARGRDGMRRDVKRHNLAVAKDESARNLNLKFQVPNAFRAHEKDFGSGLS